MSLLCEYRKSAQYCYIGFPLSPYMRDFGIWPWDLKGRHLIRWLSEQIRPHIRGVSYTDDFATMTETLILNPLRKSLRTNYNPQPFPAPLSARDLITKICPLETPKETWPLFMFSPQGLTISTKSESFSVRSRCIIVAKIISGKLHRGFEIKLCCKHHC